MRKRFCGLALALVLGPATTLAATVVITNLGDGAGTCPSSTACTLRAAIAAANPDDRIEFSASLALPATLQLVGSELTLNKNLVLAGPGANLLAVRAAAARRVLAVTAGTVSIERMALIDGRAMSPNGGSGGPGSGTPGQSAQMVEGGCIRASANTNLVLRQVALRGCEARGGDGGAGGSGDNGSPAGDGANGSAGGAARGGAIAAFGQLTVIESSVQASFARGGAGGAGGDGGDASGFAGEGEGGNGGPSGSARGGAILVNAGGALLIRNSSFVGNGASSGNGGRGGAGGNGAAAGEGAGGRGGDAGVSIGGQLHLGSSLTLADIEFSSVGPATIIAGLPGLGGNGSPDGANGLMGIARPEIYFSDTAARVRSSFFLGSSASPDCEGMVSAFGDNADSDNSCVGFTLQGIFTANFFGPAIDEQNGRAALLPKAGSLSIDAAADCTDMLGATVPTDQNGGSRPVDGNLDGSALCDVGAVEFEPHIFADGFEP